MADREKHKTRHDWRKKEGNFTGKRYTREEILQAYAVFPLPVFSSAAVELISEPSLPPCATETPVFSCTSSRRTEQMPEWYTDDPPSTLITLKPQDFDEEYSKIDMKYEDSIKKLIEEDEDYPEWDVPEDPAKDLTTPEVIIYPLNLIQTLADEGNPFACIIMSHSLTSDDSVITNPYSIPFEQVWFYKDPQNNIQGPFTTIDMFNWSAAGYFSSNLQIAHSSPSHFFSLKMYILQEKYKSMANSLD